MRQRFERIREKDQKVDLAVGDLGADLLIPAQRSTLEFGNVATQFPFQDHAGRACGIERVVGQEGLVVFGPFNEILLLIVVRNQGDFLIVFHRDFLLCHTALFPFSGKSVLLLDREAALVLGCLALTQYTSLRRLWRAIATKSPSM